MTWVLIATLLLWLAFGPWVLVIAAGLLLVPRVRWWVQDRLYLSRRGTTIAAALVAVVAGLVVVAPDGWLPIPPGPGVLATPSYLGRPATAKPVIAQPVPQHPHLARNGASTGDGDAWATDASPWSGPLGLQPEVDTAWWGLEECSDLTFDTRDRLVAVCAGRAGPTLHVIDPETMRKAASLDLPDRDQSQPEGLAGAALCRGTHFYLDDRDRAVLATTDRGIQAISTADGAGEPDLALDQTWDLRPYVPAGDCLIALLPDWSGRIWWASLSGLVGTITPGGGDDAVDAVAVHDLGEGIVNSFAAAEGGGIHVVTDEALHRLAVGPGGTPQVAWRLPYDRGQEQKPGQLSRGSGTTPTLLDGGVVAITDNAEPRMHVVFVDGHSGEEICRRPVFGEDASATGVSLVSLGSGVVVVNNHGYGGLRSTLLGLATEPGLARVDVAGGECTVRWTSDQVSPSSGARASWANGLVYAYTKRPTWTGVSAWYVTALDVETGRAMWSVRTGTGALFDNHHASIALGPDASLWTATVAGLVRVRDRR